MIKKRYSQYIKTEDGTSLYVWTNFDPKNHDPDDHVIIFNPGLCSDNAHWEFQIRYFNETGKKILIHNYRGHFNSQGRGDISETGFDTIANDLNFILDHLNIKKPILFGHSMGVSVCLELITKFPDKAFALVLISGTIFPPLRTMFSLKAMSFAVHFLNFVQRSFPNAFESFWKDLRFNPLIRQIIYQKSFTRKTPVEFTEVFVNRMTQLHPTTFTRFLEGMENHNVISSLPEISVPTLVMGGDKDDVIPFSVQRAIKEKIPNSEIYLIKGARHIPQLEFHSSVNERINLFLKKLEAL